MEKCWLVQINGIRFGNERNNGTHAQVMSNQGQKNFVGQGPSSIMKTATKVAMYQCHQVGLTRCPEHREFDPLKGIEVEGRREDRMALKGRQNRNDAKTLSTCSHAVTAGKWLRTSQKLCSVQTA